MIVFTTTDMMNSQLKYGLNELVWRDPSSF